MPDETRNGSKLPYPVCFVANSISESKSVIISSLSIFFMSSLPLFTTCFVTLIHIDSLWVQIGHPANIDDSNICEQGYLPNKSTTFKLILSDPEVNRLLGDPGSNSQRSNCCTMGRQMLPGNKIITDPAVAQFEHICL